MRGCSFVELSPGAFFYNVIDATERVICCTHCPALIAKSLLSSHATQYSCVRSHVEGTGIVRSGDITKDPQYGHNAPHHGMPPGHLPVRSYLAVPVQAQSGEVLGGLFYGHEKTDVFSRMWRTLSRRLRLKQPLQWKPPSSRTVDWKV